MDTKEAIAQGKDWLSSDMLDALTSYWNDGGKLKKEIEEILQTLIALAERVESVKGLPEKTECHKTDTFGCGGCIRNKIIDDCKLYMAKRGER